MKGMMMLRVALIGAGRIGAIHGANVASNPNTQLAGVCDAVAASAEALAKKLNVPVLTLEQIWQDASIDAVVIGSSTDTHAPLILDAAKHGKHIFCEKPVDLSLDNAQKCADAVKAANVRCMIGFQRRYDPTFAKAHDAIVSGKIGSPECVIITSRDPGAPPLDYIKRSGGIYRDMLIHDFDMCRWLLGEEPNWLMACGSVLTDPAIAGHDADTTAVTLRTASGKLCQINTSRRAAYGYDQRFEVLGSKGMVQANNVSSANTVLANEAGFMGELPEPFFLERYAKAYVNELNHFIDALRTGEPFVTDIADAVLTQRLADAAAKSFESGQPVHLA